MLLLETLRFPASMNVRTRGACERQGHPDQCSQPEHSLRSELQSRYLSAQRASHPRGRMNLPEISGGHDPCR